MSRRLVVGGGLRRVGAPPLLCLMLAVGTTGCGDFFVEAACAGGEYPAVRGNGGGRICLKDGQEPTDAYVRFPAHHVPLKADDDYSPTLGDYLTDGDERQRAIARKQLQQLLEADPSRTRKEMLSGPIFPSGYPPESQRP